MDAQHILLLVRPFGVIGVTIGDLADPATWVFQGGDAAAAHQAIAEALSPPQPSAPFWPSSLDMLRADLARVKTFVGVPDNG